MAQTAEVTQEEIDRILQMLQDGGGDTSILTPEEIALVEVHLDKPEERRKTDHDDNLAEHMSEGELNALAQDVIQWFEWDDQSRAEWKERETKGMMMLGVTEKTEGGATFKGASKVVHPLLMEACIQYQSRAMSELWPAEGPVKGVIVGDSTPEREEQRDRVVDYMNYQYTTDIPGAYESEDRLQFRLPLSGSCFTKAYRDPIKGKVRRDFIDPNYFVIAYGATSLRDCNRYTHWYYEGEKSLKQKQANGFYINTDLMMPYEDLGAGNGSKEVQDAIDDSDGHNQVNTTDNQRYTILEMHVDLDLPGFEDIDKKGEKTGIPQPYIVIVEKSNMRTLAVYRNWKEDDEQKEKKVPFTHRYFLPGLGFYGYGFLHAIGGLARSATGALRALLDSAQFANMPGGFRPKGLLPNDTLTINPGEWAELPIDAEDFKNAFFTPPYKEPSMALYHLLGSLDDMGRRFAHTTEAMVGEGNNNGPVGTTVALIEQGMKLFSSIHKRQHVSLGEEFKIVADLNGEELPNGQEAYPYDVPGASREVKTSDFDGRIDVQPVSDPNIVTSAQRIATAQAVLQLADENPDLYDRYEAHKRMLSAMRVENPDDVLIDKSKIVRMGPVEENIKILQGGGVKAFLDQDHQSHLIVHEDWFNGLPKPKQEQLMPMYMAHMAEHIAESYLLQIEQETRQQHPGAILFDQRFDEKKEPLQELPIQQENFIAQHVAAAIQQKQQQIAAQQPPDPKLLEAQRNQDRKDAEAKRTQDRNDAVAERDAHRKDVVAAHDEHRKDTQLAVDLHRQQQEAKQDNG